MGDIYHISIFEKKSDYIYIIYHIIFIYNHYNNTTISSRIYIIKGDNIGIFEGYTIYIYIYL